MLRVEMTVPVVRRTPGRFSGRRGGTPRPTRLRHLNHYLLLCSERLPEIRRKRCPAGGSRSPGFASHPEDECESQSSQGASRLKYVVLGDSCQFVVRSFPFFQDKSRTRTRVEDDGRWTKHQALSTKNQEPSTILQKKPSPTRQGKVIELQAPAGACLLKHRCYSNSSLTSRTGRYDAAVLTAPPSTKMVPVPPSSMAPESGVSTSLSLT
jgi:hypothetical protein